MPDDRQELTGWLAEYSELSQQYQTIAGPYESQIKALEAERDNATAALTFQMDTLQALIRPHILEAKQTTKVPFVTVSYVRGDKWDRDILFHIAKEVPAVLTAYEDGSFVRFRKTTS
jgi:hypothetical protein